VEPLVLVVTLEVRREAAVEFRAYETAAARIMTAYGGRIEREVEVESEAGASTFREIHIVSFPDAAALDAYRRDSELAGLAAMRERAVESTIVVRGRDRKFSYSFQ
jgi:uncharacterized protein (DUF1330 family)